MKRAWLVLAAAALGATAQAQQITSVGNLRHVVANLDQSVTLYRDVFGLLVATPAGPFEASPARQMLEDTPGAQSRRAELPIPGLKNSLELVEYRGVNQQRAYARLQDPGAGVLHLSLANLQQTVRRGIAGGAHEITATDARQGQYLQDQDGFILRLTQLQVQVTTNLVYPTEPPSRPDNFFSLRAPEAGFEFSVQNLNQTLAAYRALGLQASERNTLPIEGDVIIGRSVISFVQFSNDDRKPLHTRPQDPGTSILQLNVRGLDALLPKLTAAGFTIVTRGGRPVDLNGVRMILVRATDNLYLELIEPEQVI